MYIHELRVPIAVKTPLGDGKCIAWIDYSPDTNTVWKCRLDLTGQVRNFYDDDIIIYPNLMNGEPELSVVPKKDMFTEHEHSESVNKPAYGATVYCGTGGKQPE